jgi:hypothetical protein
MLLVALSSLLLAAPQEVVTTPPPTTQEATATPPPIAQEQEPQEPQDKEIEIGDQRWNETIMIPDGVELLKEKSLPYVPADGLNASVQRSDDFLGMRFFRVDIAPGQTFRATIKAFSKSAYKLNFVFPQNQIEIKHPLSLKLKSAISLQETRNLSYIQFKNTTKEPYGVTFNIVGSEEKPYSIIIKRTGGQ